jgi:hypothetical protein
VRTTCLARSAISSSGSARTGLRQRRCSRVRTSQWACLTKCVLLGEMQERSDPIQIKFIPRYRSPSITRYISPSIPRYRPCGLVSCATQTIPRRPRVQWRMRRADKYPRDSLAAHILACGAQFLPALLCPCTRRGRVRQIISNAKRFQRGDWKGLWETAYPWCQFLATQNAFGVARNLLLMETYITLMI